MLPLDLESGLGMPIKVWGKKQNFEFEYWLSKESDRVEQSQVEIRWIQKFTHTHTHTYMHMHTLFQKHLSRDTLGSVMIYEKSFIDPSLKDL